MKQLSLLESILSHEKNLQATRQAEWVLATLYRHLMDGEIFIHPTTMVIFYVCKYECCMNTDKYANLINKKLL